MGPRQLIFPRTRPALKEPLCRADQVPNDSALHLRGVRGDFRGEGTLEQGLKQLGRILTGEKGHSKPEKVYEQFRKVLAEIW